MPLRGVHHTSFTVTDLERTVAFYRDVLGMRLVARKRRTSDDLAVALLGPQATGTGAADILIADMQLGDARVEFIQYLDPTTRPFPGDPSVAGSAHIALETTDIDEEYRRLQEAGVRFHTPVRTVRDPGRPIWRWCYFRDPDGICVELVQGGEPRPRQRTNAVVRWLGIILPLVLTYPIAGGLFGWLFGDTGLWQFQVLISIGGAVWLGLTVALLLRRDWRGAAAITVFYVIVDAWWWLLALRIIRFD